MPTTNASFAKELAALITRSLEAGAEPQEVVDELTREANLIFGKFNLELYAVAKQKA